MTSLLVSLLHFGILISFSPNSLRSSEIQPIMADLNGDARDEMIVASRETGLISLLSEDFQIGWHPWEPALRVGKGLAAVDVLDTNGDAVPEILAINSKTGDFFIFEIGANHRFEKTLNFKVGQSPIDFAVADFNGDGRPDLAILDATGPKMHIFFNAGGNHFEASQSYALKGSPSVVIASDHDADGLIDLYTFNNEQSSAIDNLLLNQNFGFFVVQTGQPH